MVITWSDGTTENAFLSQGIFTLNGVKRTLVGICFNFHPLGTWWSTANLALLHKEIDYLQSIGVLLIQIQMDSTGITNGYKPVLDLLYQHKMLVLPLFTNKWYTDSLSNPNFPIGSYTVNSLTNALCTILVNYSNIVSIIMENELDVLQSSDSWTAVEAANYVSYMKGIIRTYYPLLPLTTKLCGVNWQNGFKSALLSVVDYIGFDYYPTSPNEAATMTSYIQSNWSSKGWMSTEFNAHGPNDPHAADFTHNYLDSVLASGKPGAVFLWVANKPSTASMAEAAFFDASGNPIQAIVNLAPYIPKIQGGASLKVTFEGILKEAVSGNPVSAKPVNIKVTKPDNSSENLTATTLAGAFTTNATYTVAGNYTAVASYPGDATYNSVSSPSVSFVVTASKLDLIITLTAS
jgi:hypothetical protein